MPGGILAVFNRHMSRPPTVAVVSDDHRVGRALVAYLSSNGSAVAQVALEELVRQLTDASNNQDDPAGG